jgi:DNA topoisomerase-1
VADQLSAIDARAINTLPLGKDPNGNEIVVRVGRYGAYLQRGEETARLADQIAPDELSIARAVELLAAPGPDRELGVDPASGHRVFVRTGRYGAYVQLGEANSGKDKPKTASLLSSMNPQQIDLGQALSVLELPRTVGVDPRDGEPVTAQLGRYGPYVSKGDESRSLEREEQVFTVTLEQALDLLAGPRRRRARTPAGPLRELGVDPVSGRAITLREGRFGPYVTDGETNASLKKMDSPGSLTPERAQELMQERRDRGPVTRKPRRRARPGDGKDAKGVRADDGQRPRHKHGAEAESGAKSRGRTGQRKTRPGKPSSRGKAAVVVRRKPNASATSPVGS